MFFPLFSLFAFGALAQETVTTPPIYSAPPEQSASILPTPSSTAQSTLPAELPSGTPSPRPYVSEVPTVYIDPTYPTTTAMTNGSNTSVAYTPKTRYNNGTVIVNPETTNSAAPTRYTDPETPMDPAEYGGGAAGVRVVVGGVVMAVFVVIGGSVLL